MKHHCHAGFSIPAAAKKLKMKEGVVRRAVDLGQIKTVPFAGLRRVPPAEIERIRQLLGIESDGPETAINDGSEAA